MKFLVMGGIWFWEGNGPFGRKDVPLTLPFHQKDFEAADPKAAIVAVKDQLKKLKEVYPSRRYKDYGVQIRLFIEGAKDPFWQYNFAKGKASPAHYNQRPIDRSMAEAVETFVIHPATNFQEPRQIFKKGGVIRFRPEFNKRPKQARVV